MLVLEFIPAHVWIWLLTNCLLIWGILGFSMIYPLSKEYFVNLLLNWQNESSHCSQRSWICWRSTASPEYWEAAAVPPEQGLDYLLIIKHISFPYNAELIQFFPSTSHDLSDMNRVHKHIVVVLCLTCSKNSSMKWSLSTCTTSSSSSLSLACRHTQNNIRSLGSHLFLLNVL